MSSFEFLGFSCSSGAAAAAPERRQAAGVSPGVFEEAAGQSDGGERSCHPQSEEATGLWEEKVKVLGSFPEHETSHLTLSSIFWPKACWGSPEPNGGSGEERSLNSSEKGVQRAQNISDTVTGGCSSTGRVQGPGGQKEPGSHHQNQPQGGFEADLPGEMWPGEGLASITMKAGLQLWGKVVWALVHPVSTEVPLGKTLNGQLCKWVKVCSVRRFGTVAIRL